MLKIRPHQIAHDRRTVLRERVEHPSTHANCRQSAETLFLKLLYTSATRLSTPRVAMTA